MPEEDLEPIVHDPSFDSSKWEGQLILSKYKENLYFKRMNEYEQSVRVNYSREIFPYVECMYINGDELLGMDPNIMEAMGHGKVDQAQITLLRLVQAL